MLDNRTILFTLILVSYALLLFSFFTTGNVGKRSLVLYRLSNLSFTLGFSLLYIQFTGNLFLSVILANVLIYSSFLLFSLTVLSFIRVEVKLWVFLLFLMEHILTFLYFTYIQSNTLMRILIISFNIIITLAIVMVLAISSNPARRKTLNLFLVTSGLYIGVSFFRIFYTLGTHYRIQSIFSPDGATSLIFLSSMAYFLSLNSIIFLFINTHYKAELTEKIFLLEQSHRDIQYINTFFGSYRNNLEKQELYSRITEYLMSRFLVEGCLLFLLDEKKKELILTHMAGFPPPDSPEPLSIPLTASALTVQAIEKKTTLFQTLKPGDGLSFSKNLIEAGFRRIAAIPIHTSTGIIGVLTLGVKSLDSLMEKEIDTITLISNQLGTIIENARQYEALSRMASTDPLTGVWNRRALLQHFEDALRVHQRYGRPVALMMMDIDKFKNFNDTYGHETGDRILKELVNLSSVLLRDSDVLGRFGGEEFVVLLQETSMEQGYHLAERLRKNIEEFHLDSEKGPVGFTISIGVTEVVPEDSMESALFRADKAMYKAKNMGRNCTFVFRKGDPD